MPSVGKKKEKDICVRSLIGVPAVWLSHKTKKCETTNAMTPPPLPTYPHKCAPISPLTNECGQRATYNVTPILESFSGSLFTLSRLGMNPKQIGSHRPSTRHTPPTRISQIPNSKAQQNPHQRGSQRNDKTSAIRQGCRPRWHHK